MSTLQRAQRFVTQRWVQRPQERQFIQAVQAVYTRWAPRHRSWANAFFDEHFLVQRAPRLLAQYHLGRMNSEEQWLAQQWAAQFRFNPARKQALIAEVTPAVANFLYHLKVELGAQEKRDRHGGWLLWLGDWAKRGQTL